MRNGRSLRETRDGVRHYCNNITGTERQAIVVQNVIWTIIHACYSVSYASEAPCRQLIRRERGREGVKKRRGAGGGAMIGSRAILFINRLESTRKIKGKKGNLAPSGKSQDTPWFLPSPFHRTHLSTFSALKVTHLRCARERLQRRMRSISFAATLSAPPSSS